MPTETEQQRARTLAVSLICGGGVLSSIKATAALFDHDYSLAVIYLAVFQANLGWLLQGRDPAAASESPLLEPASISRETLHPVSVHALAGSLSLPYETTRRAVGRLIEKGFARRVSHSGIALDLERLARPAFSDVADHLLRATAQAEGQLQAQGLAPRSA